MVLEVTRYVSHSMCYVGFGGSLNPIIQAHVSALSHQLAHEMTRSNVLDHTLVAHLWQDGLSIGAKFRKRARV